ncbi:UPF0149 family protein [Brucella anthropi]|nr:UPF0149 family protein [Brucella anthropi]
MQLTNLDGFLTRIAVGHDEIPIGEWLSEVWGEDPEFVDDEEKSAATQAITNLYNEIVSQLAEGLAEPILMHIAETDEFIADGWVKGFMRAIALRSCRWEKMMGSEAGVLLAPVVMLTDIDTFTDGADLGFDDFCGSKRMRSMRCLT